MMPGVQCLPLTRPLLAAATNSQGLPALSVQRWLRSPDRLSIDAPADSALASLLHLLHVSSLAQCGLLLLSPTCAPYF
jgi:hypothetical protein